MISSTPKLTIEGHRGHKPLENSLKGFQKCLHLPVQGIETDLWLMKDKSVLIHHGYSQLGLLKLRNKDTDQLLMTHARHLTREDLEVYVDNKDGTRLLTLPELLDIFREKPSLYLNLEIKDSSFEAVEAAVRVLDRVRPENEIQISSFYYSVKTHLGKLKTEFQFLERVSFGFLARAEEDLGRMASFLGGCRWTNSKRTRVKGRL